LSCTDAVLVDVAAEAHQRRPLRGRCDSKTRLRRNLRADTPENAGSGNARLPVMARENRREHHVAVTVPADEVDAEGVVLPVGIKAAWSVIREARRRFHDQQSQ
jgi:hypothetical protein